MRTSILIVVNHTFFRNARNLPDHCYWHGWQHGVVFVYVLGYGRHHNHMIFSSPLGKRPTIFTISEPSSFMETR
jgi:hypothetical protein